MPNSGFFGRLFGDGGDAPTGRRLAFAAEPAAIYAVGDVHGRLDLLEQLEAAILADAAGRKGELWLLLLGDITDRGPATAGVIAHLLTQPLSGFTRHCLRGNHEEMMLDFLANPSSDHIWLANGGLATLKSYGMSEAQLFETLDARRLRGLIEAALPPEHLVFLESLPVMIETPGFAFVHAGVRPGVPLAGQSDRDLLWFRDNYASDYAEFPKTVVHGHTPRPDALLLPKRIALDTGAVITGKLSAARLVAGQPPVLITATA